MEVCVCREPKMLRDAPNDVHTIRTTWLRNHERWKLFEHKVPSNRKGSKQISEYHDRGVFVFTRRVASTDVQDPAMLAACVPHKPNPIHMSLRKLQSGRERKPRPRTHSGILYPPGACCRTRIDPAILFCSRTHGAGSSQHRPCLGAACRRAVCK